jgi:hypothetical protein
MNVTASGHNRSPVMSTNTLIKDLSIDRAPKFLDNNVPYILRAKEAPDYLNLTNTY